MALLNPLYLDVNGKTYEGWQRVRIERSVDKATTTWGIAATRTWPGMEGKWWLKPGDKVKVRIYDHVICTGHIDSLKVDYDSGAHNIEVSGRGLVADLVDCSYIGPPWQWKEGDPKDIIETICKQHSIKVKVETDLGEPLDFQIQQGEECWAAIERITRLRQVLAYEDLDGSLIISNASEEFIETRLTQGDNILAASAEIDDKDRFSIYYVKGQQKTKKGGDEVTPEKAAFSFSGAVTDESVSRYRPMLLVQSANTDDMTAIDRANWEKQNRWGKSRSCEITVGGWVQPNGELWPINKLCEVIDTWMGLDRELAITETSYEVSSSGLRTVLKLAPPEALIPDPTKGKKGKDDKKGKKGKGKGKGKGGAGGGDGWNQIRETVDNADVQSRKESKQ